MKVILIDWNAYGNEYMEKLFRSRGYDVRKCRFDGHLKGTERAKAVSDLRECVGAFRPDYVFSYHYFPNVSEVCNETGTPYLAWIYDSPAFDLYSYTVLNPVNRIFVFDRGVYEEFAASGIETVHHLPLGVVCRDEVGSPESSEYGASTDDATNEVYKSPHSYNSDITFIGSMYTEPKHRLYDKFSTISDYAKGYLDAVIEAQKHVYGMNFLESFITPEIEAEMQKAYPTDPNTTNAMTPAKIYSQFVLSRQVTAIERMDIMTRIGDYALKYSTEHRDLAGGGQLRVNLYTHDSSLKINGIRNKGPVEYDESMYKIFAASRINLNITLRSILTGIPLRALDIMSCGGFLLSNYQAELCEYFTAGEDFDYYEDYDDLMLKLDYYLSHEKERQDMALSAREKLRREHSLSSRLDTMEATL